MYFLPTLQFPLDTLQFPFEVNISELKSALNASLRLRIERFQCQLLWRLKLGAGPAAIQSLEIICQARIAKSFSAPASCARKADHLFIVHRPLVLQLSFPYLVTPATIILNGYAILLDIYHRKSKI